MTTITVPMSGLQVSNSTLNDTLQAGSDVPAGSTAEYELDGTSTLQSLNIGTAVEVEVGSPFGFPTGSLTGTGNVTGTYNPAAVLPALTNYGLLDINGTVAVPLNNNATLRVAAGEKLDVEGDLYSLGATTVTVAAGAELDLNSQNSALISDLSAAGTVKVSAPSTALSGPTSLATVIVQGDAANAFAGTAASPHIAKLELEQATFTAPINSVTLGQDAQIRFGTGPTTVQHLTIAGSSTALVPLDLVIVDGTLAVSGDGMRTPNQVAVSMAEFTNGGTADFTVAATDGGASLQRQLVVDANTTLRNDAAMTIGGQGTVATTIGATGAASGSTFINGAAGQLTIGAGASLSVAAIQNAGAIAVSGSTSLLQPTTNTGTIDVASGTLGLEAATQGAGTIAVERGATLSVDAAASQGTVALRSGGVLRLSQPATFTDTIQVPSTGGSLDLSGVTATSATVSNGAITVGTATGPISLAETGLVNGTTLTIGSDGSGGSMLALAATVTPTPPPTASHPAVYRFFDDVHGTQFLTSSLGESQNLQATRPDLVYEGVGLASVDPTADPAAAPVYRFFDTRYGTHFYTSSTTEQSTIAATRPDLVSEGIGFYEHATQQTGDVAVYRYFETTLGTHFFTDSAAERTTIAATRPDLVSEGVAFYAPST